ncbi:hypothetical protein PAXRUDRAFT_148635 [Paxillus rubicundulus Ve08.2h10]|uniref:Uncharacterized protein n=1 Tax=Paxillus rubicundulus Ve08.2h10 TaxID=930991 RepID=A0A0D0E3V9_9AGAM|nr:hypothetical protein PAXRUDRAFT_148635 [Paxillus rubicundulus Ve08.2h10]
MVHPFLFLFPFKIYTDSCHHNRFATCSLYFMDAYHKGLNGKQVAFAVRKYCGHHTLPLIVFDNLKKAQMSQCIV